MTHPSKVKGNSFEREVIGLAKHWGLIAERSWGSDGRSRGLSKDVDVTIQVRRGALKTFRLQCKRRAKIPTWAQTGGTVDAVVYRADYGPSYVAMPYINLLELLYGLNVLSEKEKAPEAES